ncbi:phage major capsid protein [Fictibacillus nanhaiensis]|uniref:phage major capsid protein n=1 Tax=Fictibacillus nanhaiensis TaxID=742169 RepID=UPI00203E818F|nr:phage major capsid protein [Fictibacillus nanhaiensis]MCM3730065.1 phage major capsid protein [Fictibacillus nanhaiensis]
MKKIDELKQELAAKKEEVRSLNDAKKVEEASAKLEEVRGLQKQIEIQMELDKEEEREMENKMEKRNNEVKVVNSEEMQYRAIAKHLLGQEMTAEERASINVSNNGAILPEGFVNQLQVLQKGFPALKGYTHVIPVTTNTGKMPVSNGSAVRKLAKLAVDTEMVKEMITTSPVEFAVEDYGKLYPVDNSAMEDSAVEIINGLIAPDVAECQVNSENAEIIKIVKDNAVAGSAGTDYKAIVKTLNTKVLPSLKAGTVIVTNMDGYDYLDGLSDTTGRPLLIDSLAVEGGKVFKGREVVVLDNADLPEVTVGKKPFYIVNLFALVKFFDRKGYEIAKSSEAGFTYNQTLVRVIGRFDTVKGDNRANFFVEL